MAEGDLEAAWDQPADVRHHQVPLSWPQQLKMLGFGRFRMMEGTVGLTVEPSPCVPFSSAKNPAQWHPRDEMETSVLVVSEYCFVHFGVFPCPVMMTRSVSFHFWTTRPSEIRTLATQVVLAPASSKMLLLLWAGLLQRIVGAAWLLVHPELSYQMQMLFRSYYGWCAAVQFE